LTFCGTCGTIKAGIIVQICIFNTKIQVFS
jgi:hypothetical protein